MARRYYDMSYTYKPKLAKSAIGKIYPHQPRVRYYTYHDTDLIGAYQASFIVESERRKYFDRKAKDTFARAMKHLKGEK